jgi:hypothetical protein
MYEAKLLPMEELMDGVTERELVLSVDADTRTIEESNP